MNSFITNIQNLFKRRSSREDEKFNLIRTAFLRIEPQLQSSILDFSSIKFFIDTVDSVLNLEDELESKICIVQKLRKYLKYLFTGIYQKIKEKTEHKLTDYYSLQSSIYFILLLIINIREANVLLPILFEDESNFIVIFLNCLQLSFLFTNQQDVIKSIMNFFSSQIVTLFYTLGCEIEYNKFKDKVMKVCVSKIDYKKYSGIEYKILIKYLLVMEYDLKSLFKEKHICDNEDIPLIISLLYQACLRIVFSIQKQEYLKLIETDNHFIERSLSKTAKHNRTSNSLGISNLIENIYIDPKVFQCFELEFLYNISEKCVLYYFERYGPKTQTLFRREESYDELIKTILFTYGGSMFFSIYDSIKKFLNGNTIETKEILELVDVIIDVLFSKCPMLIKILLNNIHKHIKAIYSVSSYEPLIVLMFFNFLFNPKVQKNNGFNPTDEKLRRISNIISKGCFNQLFNENDSLSLYNIHIPTINKKFLLSMDCMVEKINVIDKNEQYRILCTELYEDGLILPESMFYIECDFIIKVLYDLNVISILNDEEKFNIEDDNESYLGSFYVKFDKIKADKLVMEFEKEGVEYEYNEDVDI